VANAAKGKKAEIRSQEVVGAASCREGLKGEEQVSRGGAANAAKGKGNIGLARPTLKDRAALPAFYNIKGGSREK
jgi:hypothetical protein